MYKRSKVFGINIGNQPLSLALTVNLYSFPGCNALPTFKVPVNGSKVKLY